MKIIKDGNEITPALKGNYTSLLEDLNSVNSNKVEDFCFDYMLYNSLQRIVHKKCNRLDSNIAKTKSAKER
jgi:hypothetical protein